MTALKEWAADLAVILIVTGVAMKTVSGNSERKAVRFVVTLILITSVFRLNIGIGTKFNTKIADTVACDTAKINDEFEGYIIEMEKSFIDRRIQAAVFEICKNAVVKTEITDDNIIIKISGGSIDRNNISGLKNKLSDEFGCEIIIESGDENDG